MLTIRGIKINILKILPVLAAICAAMATLLSLAAYFEQKPISEEKLSTLLTQNNPSITIASDNILISKDNFDLLFTLPAKELSQAGFDSLQINGIKVLKNDRTSRFYYQLSSRMIEIRSQYLLKPSENTIRFIFKNKSIEYKLKLEYSVSFASNSKINSDYWYQGELQWSHLASDGLFLFNNGKVASNRSFGFRRRFENNVGIEVGFIPKGSPINMSIYFGAGFTIYIGIHDDRSIQIVQAKKPFERDKIYASSSFRFFPGRYYRIKATKDNNIYKVILIDSANSHTLIAYKDKTPKENKNQIFKNVGIGLWEGSKGILIKEIKINSSEKL